MDARTLAHNLGVLLAAVEDVRAELAALRAERDAPEDTDELAEGCFDMEAAIAFSGMSRAELFKAMAAKRLSFLQPNGPHTKRLIPRRALKDFLRGLRVEEAQAADAGYD